MRHDPTRPIWDGLLQDVKTAFLSHKALIEFCAFPDDLTPQTVAPYPIPAASLLARETGLVSETYQSLCDGVVAAGPFAKWRETYKGTEIAQDFMDRFGCYALIGTGGAFQSAQMWAWTVYMPAGLYYPFHHHPGEEMYLVLAGEAVFMCEGAPDQILREGGTSRHGSNQPHAMETRNQPVLCLVVWRNGFETAPVLTG